MTNEIKAQLLSFISDCKTLKELERLQTRIDRIVGGATPPDLSEKLNEKKTELLNK